LTLAPVAEHPHLVPAAHQLAGDRELDADVSTAVPDHLEHPHA
jgi:hypothetical protein